MRLKEIRESKKITVPQLVELSGVPRRTIQDIEKNGNCKVDTAIKLADALQVTLDELCRDKELPGS
jgi:transcriptional regulator with XRE-family HTH domain